MGISKDLVAASATPLILSILREEPSYGYAIIKQVELLSEGSLQWADGMLYPVLHRLEAQGFIESFWQAAPTGRKRKYYRIRSEGEAELERAQADWLVVHATLKRTWTVSSSAVHRTSANRVPDMPALELL